MHNNKIIDTLNKYIQTTKNYAKDLKVAFVTSILNETIAFDDFVEHSITTSYLTRKSCDKLLTYFRENEIYTELYTDFEDFIQEYYSGVRKFNIVFETSPKGIAKGKDALIPSFCDSVGLRHIGPDAAANIR